VAYLGPEPLPKRGERATGCDYVGRKSCGCYTVWISGSDPPASKARLIARLKREGFEVFTCRPAWARENVRECHCDRQATLDFEPERISRGGG
jgi:hypothetical protein